MKKFVVWLLILFSLHSYNLFAQASKKSKSFQLVIEFKNVVDSVQMHLGNIYKNPFDESYAITMFKYYISNIALKQVNGKTIFVPGAHLINEADSESKKIKIKNLAGSIKSISFLLGVDSILNCSGTKAGDLDPAKGMFWTWNSGYVVAKLEATSPASSAPANKVEWHIGGYKKGENVSRKIMLNVNTKVLQNKNTGTSYLLIEANANKWFVGSHDIKIASHPVCTTPGLLAVEVADNLSGMFKIAFIK